MTRYRISFFDRKNHPAGVKLVTCPTDDDALAQAAEMVSDQRGAEVSEGLGVSVSWRHGG